MASSNINPFKTGDKVVCVNAYNSFYLKYEKEYTVDCCLEGCVLLKELLSVRGGFEIDRFKLVPQPSFKSFLSPLCRVELRNGDKYVYARGEFVNLVEVVSSESQYQSNGKVMPQYSCPLNKELEIVRVYAEPTHLVGILNPDNIGKLLWECPELIAEQAKKEEKKAELQKEIKEWEAKRESSLLQANSATSVINDLEKQLKELE